MIIGHENPLRFLKKAYENGKVPHALFFWGPKEVGKKTIATAFARSFICDKKTFLGCGSCDTCQLSSPTRLSHILLTSQIKREIEDDRQGMGIEVIDEIRNRLQTSSFFQKPRVVIIEKVSDLSDEGSNRLLKILEEPPEDTYFIILAESKESALPTILSRTVPLRFTLVPQKILLEYIEQKHSKISREEAVMLARFSQGRPGRLIEGLADPSIIKEAQKRYSLVFGLFSNPLYASLQKIDELLKNDEPLDAYPEYVFAAFRSILFLHQQHEPPYGLKIPETVAKKFIQRYSSQSCLRIFKELFKTQSLLQQTNVNTRIAFESFILEL